MDLIRATYVVEFAQPLQPWVELRALFRAAGDNPEGEVEGQPIVIARQDVRQRVTLTVRGFAIDQEAPDGATTSWDAVTTRSQALAKASVLPDVLWTRCTAIWVEPFELPFSELVARLKDRLFVPSPLASATTDLSAIYEERTGDNEVLSVQIGPMAPDQLNRDYVAFRRGGLPDQFVFLSITRYSGEQSAFSLDRVGGDIHRLTELAESRTAYVQGLLEG